MGPCVAGKPLKSLREALSNVYRKRVIVRASIRQLCIHAVEWYGDAESARIALLSAGPQEPRRETRGFGRSNQGRIERSPRSRKGWIRARQAEIIERASRCNWRIVQDGKRTGTAAEPSQNSGN